MHSLGGGHGLVTVNVLGTNKTSSVFLLVQLWEVLWQFFSQHEFD
jgi:hypothetical protein